MILLRSLESMRAFVSYEIIRYLYMLWTAVGRDRIVLSSISGGEIGLDVA